ncbi:TetR/AcrR family transcriptional regulator [Nocardioides marmorisolisilvae]|uniref:TetR/AcrR family transcriptional regulator n=1 Tax=Nocardioides marmorisolisilvae TaxID=1542737 RepID=A0A3N0DY25_9ACTN|nr:TetR/AcrR family transcriptional regulator [Nocardioides marmorisolisilvae]RNL80509.1 TetR/AcrR family transcriptional regulator [Nocardioides marmorisolisilvae]
MRLLVTREEYFDAAMEILATDGAGSLKITVLCKRLKVTSGSFYGYFGSFDGFVVELLEFWEDAQTLRIEELSNAPDDPAERIHTMRVLAGTVPHEAEAAIRSWAHTHPIVAVAQKRVDERRLAALTDIIRPACRTQAEAHQLGMMGMTLLVGIQQWRSPVKKKEFDALFDEYEAVVMGKYAVTHG